MKKTFVAAATSAALIVAPLALGASTATANPYAGSVPTKAKSKVVKKVVKKRQAPRFRFRVATGGNGKAAGKVFITVRNKRTGRTFITTRQYRGGTVTWRLRKGLPRGRYVVRIEFFTPNGSVFQNSKKIIRFRKR